MNIQRVAGRIRLNDSPEFVYALQDSIAGFVAMHGKDESAAIGMAASARVPVEVGARPEARIFL